MYQGKTISVAMAAYNGEKYIQEQLDSILAQTVVPDEIVISDDGSRDRTVAIAEDYADWYRETTAIKVLTNNPKHGIGGNFSWAIQHTTGDYVFICGQDDVWMQEKVQSVVDVFLKHPDAELVCHNLSCIDAEGGLLEKQKVNSIFLSKNLDTGQVFFASRNRYLEAACGNVLVSGPAVCISKTFSEKVLPIPSKLPEDWWLQFCAAADNSVYYLHEILTAYRIHDSTCHSANLSVPKRVRKIMQTIKGANKRSAMFLQFAEKANVYLKGLPDADAISPAVYGSIRRIEDVGAKVADAAGLSRLKGAWRLTRLYLRDQRYHRIGVKNYLTQLANILIYSKKRRRKELENL